MNTKRDCQSCKYYKDGYCENLELEPNYPNVGCDDFEIKGDKEFEQTVIAGFILGMAIGFGSKDLLMFKKKTNTSPHITPYKRLWRKINMRMMDIWQKFLI